MKEAPCRYIPGVEGVGGILAALLCLYVLKAKKKNVTLNFT